MPKTHTVWISHRSSTSPLMHRPPVKCSILSPFNCNAGVYTFRALLTMTNTSTAPPPPPLFVISEKILNRDSLNPVSYTHLPLASISKEWHGKHLFIMHLSDARSRWNQTRAQFYACMCMWGPLKAEESRHSDEPVINLSNLLTHHPHPSMTSGEHIRWTASITWYYTLLLWAFFQEN